MYEETLEKVIPVEKKIWIVRGVSGVHAHIKDMLTRTSNYVILVVPTLDRVPVDRIAALKGMVRVQIAADFRPSSSSHVRILNQLKARRGVLVRKYTGGNLMGIVVDGREALLAVIPKEHKEVLGVATVDEDWILVIQGFLNYIWTVSEHL